MSEFQYADETAMKMQQLQPAIAAGSLNDAAMVISEKKSKAMHIHSATRVSARKETEVVALKLKHVCNNCSLVCCYAERPQDPRLVLA